MHRSTRFLVTSALGLGVALAPAAAATAKPRAPHVAAKPARAAKPRPARAPKVVHVAAAGTLQSVAADGSSITFTVHGGRDKRARGTTKTFALSPTVAVTRNDAPAALADLQPGDHVALQGTVAGGVTTVTKVHADGPAATTTTSTTAPPATDPPTTTAG